MKKLGIGSTRRVLLERAALAAGDAWVERLSRELLAEQRAPTGGWPGTVGEARTWSRTYVLGVAQFWSPPPSAEELEFSARRTYAHARVKWLATQAAEPRK